LDRFGRAWNHRARRGFTVQKQDRVFLAFAANAKLDGFFERLLVGLVLELACFRARVVFDQGRALSRLKRLRGWAFDRIELTL
jgi:hypothetical protein